ncbi:UNVERIFIED_CONTAM: hypothetical protein GTU68_045024 [Idotea baltica]|nr:hypothetical protein [Idotea baltica]
MLVLSRKKEEAIVIDGQIEIQVLKIKGNTVRLGIRAPQDVKILRGEVSPFDVTFEVAMDDFNAIRDANNVKKSKAKTSEASGSEAIHSESQETPQETPKASVPPLQAYVANAVA